jgi:hypothetical protein
MENLFSSIFDVSKIQGYMEKAANDMAKNSYIKSMSFDNAFPTSALFTQQMNYALATSLSYLLTKTPNYFWTLMPDVDAYVKAFDKIQEVNNSAIKYSESYYNFLLKNLVDSKNNGNVLKSSWLETIITGVLKTYLTENEITF